VQTFCKAPGAPKPLPKVALLAKSAFLQKSCKHAKNPVQKEVRFLAQFWDSGALFAKEAQRKRGL
jgi:hypothetical protein